jgi:hypothetical protein
MSDYNPDHIGMGKFLNSPSMMRLVRGVADDIRTRAIALAPVGTLAEGDEHPGLYISSFRVRAHRFGGIHSDRAEAFVYNNAPDAFFVEYGGFGREPYHVLRRAAEGASL